MGAVVCERHEQRALLGARPVDQLQGGGEAGEGRHEPANVGKSRLVRHTHAPQMAHFSTMKYNYSTGRRHLYVQQVGVRLAQVWVSQVAAARGGPTEEESPTAVVPAVRPGCSSKCVQVA